MMPMKLLLIILMTATMSESLRRSERSVMVDGRHGTKQCVGSLKLVTNTESKIFTMSMARMLVRNIARVVVEGSCCGTIYSGLRYRGRSHRIESQGEFLTRIRKVKSVILNNC